jgi:branched-chain amino acid transport system permease protein
MKVGSISKISHSMRWVAYAAGASVLIALPWIAPAYLLSLTIKVIIFALFAVSLDFIWGYGGLISLGHAAFFGIGGYAAGVLMMHYQITNFWVITVAALSAAALIAGIFGLVALRVAGSYFLLITAALGQLLFSLAWKWRWLSTEGVEGIAGIVRPDLGIPGFEWDDARFYYFILLIFIVCYYLLGKLVRSPFGLALQGIREDELRMQALGYNTWVHKYASFILAGLFASVAGMLFAYHNGVIVPESLAIGNSTLALLIVIMGGVGTLYGPLIGAMVVIPLEFFAGVFTPERWPLILGGAFILTIMAFRKGIGVYLYALWKKGTAS